MYFKKMAECSPGERTKKNLTIERKSKVPECSPGERTEKNF